MCSSDLIRGRTDIGQGTQVVQGILHGPQIAHSVVDDDYPISHLDDEEIRLPASIDLIEEILIRMAIEDCIELRFAHLIVIQI